MLVWPARPHTQILLLLNSMEESQASQTITIICYDFKVPLDTLSFIFYVL